MKYKICLILSFVVNLSPPLARAALKTEVPSICEANLKKGPTATALRSFEVDDSTLSYQDEYYPTRFAAIRKSSRFVDAVVDGRGAEISIYFDIASKNLEPNGLRPPIWELTGDADLYAVPYTGVVGQIIPLRFDGYLYKTQFTSTRRVAVYTGIVISKDGSKNKIYVRVNERNLQSDGFREPHWERTGDAAISMKAIKN